MPARLVTLAMAFLLAPCLCLAEEAAGLKLTRISYVTGSSYYVDAGSDDGIQPGQILEVLRADTLIARLEVTDVSSHRAVCIRKEGDPLLQVGDTVRFTPGTLQIEKAPERTVSSRTPERPRRGARGFGVRGRIGIRYLLVRDLNEPDNGFSQPALDLRLDGEQMGGSPLGLNVDVRSRRTYRTAPDGTDETDGLTSVYRMAVSFQSGDSPWRAVAGRQLSPALASVNIFDGVLGEYRAERWSIGAFSGTQPDPVDLGYSSVVREHGGYVQWRSQPLSKRRWSLTTGLVGSYEEGDINREFSYVQANYMGPRLSFWLTEEADLNRGWKSDVEDGSVSLTSTFVNVNYRVGTVWTLNAGYDNRRNVRLYRDRITPETEFDDEYRNGTWAGATARFARHFRIGVDFRTRGGGDLGGADSYSLLLGAGSLTRLGLDLRSRSTRYTNTQVEGWLHSLSAGISPHRRLHVSLTGGVRDETNLADPAFTGQLTWYGLDFDLAMGQRWLLLTSFERSRSDTEDNDQLYTSLSYRF